MSRRDGVTAMAAELRIDDARIVDGTGAPWFRGCVAVEDGRIEGVYRDRDAAPDADERIDAGGDALAPGFVDAHSHSDLRPFVDPLLEPKLRQGVTTEILGQDGFSMAPLPGGDHGEWREHLAGFTGTADVPLDWETTGEYLDALAAADPAVNLATLVGHGTVRYGELGTEEREATGDERAAMAAAVEDALDAGAVGVSTGLVYAPQRAAATEELVALGEAVAPAGKPFVAHIRSEGRGIWAALDEFVRVGAETGAPLHVSHFKVVGDRQWGNAERALSRLETARRRGVDITADQYPYTAGSTPMTGLLPPWLPGDGEALLDALGDPEVRERLRADIEAGGDDWENVIGDVGWENVVIADAGGESGDADLVGRSLADIAEDRGDDPTAVLCDVLIAADLDATTIEHGMTEADVERLLAAPDVAVGTDGLYGDRPHPRLYGTYPRILGTYVREKEVVALPEAIRKMTALPARIYGLDRKGLIRPGMDADLVAFDPDAVGSPATFTRPRQFPTGIEHVVVDGTVAVRDGEPTGARAGNVLRS